MAKNLIEAASAGRDLVDDTSARKAAAVGSS